MKIRFVVLFITTLLLVGCADKYAKLVMDINVGDSKSSVIKKLGPPENRQVNGEYEVLQYCTTGTSFGVSSYEVIWLHKGKVTGITSYNQYGDGSCTAHFKTINWEKPSDMILEIRNR